MLHRITTNGRPGNIHANNDARHSTLEEVAHGLLTARRIGGIGIAIANPQLRGHHGWRCQEMRSCLAGDEIHGSQATPSSRDIPRVTMNNSSLLLGETVRNRGGKGWVLGEKRDCGRETE